MKTEESLYIKILLWAYDKQVAGFTEKELWDAFKLDDNADLQRWFIEIFKSGTNDNHPMIRHFATKNGTGYWCLTEKGMSAAIDYLDLKEARKSNKIAMRIAISSLMLATIVGTIQIVVQIYYTQ